MNILVSIMGNLVTTTNLSTKKLTFSSPGNIDTIFQLDDWSTNHILVYILNIIYILQILNQIRETILNLVYHNKHYTEKWNTPNTNGGPGNQSFICKVSEVVNKLHTHLNTCMNDENLLLTYNYYIEKYHLVYHSEGVYNEENVLHLSSVYYNGLLE